MNQSRTVIKNRQQDILDYIRSNKTLSVADASEIFQVSPLTIRRDFQTLEDQKLITRFHGGAAYNNSSFKEEIHLEEKKTLHEKAKEAIGKHVASMIPEGATLFLNSGTTTLSVLKYLNDKRVQVITNNALAPTVVHSDSINLILTGGECRNQSKSMVGTSAVEAVSKIYSSWCILGANGISNMGMTTSVYAETQINEMMVMNCKGKVVLVADGSKIGKNFDFFSVPSRDIDMLVTDSSASPEELAKMEKQGIEIIKLEV